MLHLSLVMGSSWPSEWQVIQFQNPILLPVLLDHSQYQLLQVGGNTGFSRSRLWDGAFVRDQQLQKRGGRVGLPRRRSQTDTGTTKTWPTPQGAQEHIWPIRLSHTELKWLDLYIHLSQSLQVGCPWMRQLSAVETNPERAESLKIYADNRGNKSFLAEGSKKRILYTPQSTLALFRSTSSHPLGSNTLDSREHLFLEKLRGSLARWNIAPSTASVIRNMASTQHLSLLLSLFDSSYVSHHICRPQWLT